MKLSVTFSSAKRVAAGMIPCGLLLLLPACQIPHLRQAELTPTLPSGYTGADNSGTTGATALGPNSAGQLPVEQFFGDPTLTGLINQGLASNRELKILEEEIQVARAEIQSRTGAFLPLIGLRGTAGLDKNSRFTPIGAAEEQLQYEPGKNFPQVPGDFLLGINVLLPLDIWRELRNARDAARQRYLAAIERRNDFVTRMVADIAENYYTLMALDQRLDTLDKTIALQQDSLRAAKLLFEAGRVTDLPVQRFQAEVRKNESEKQVVRQEIVEAENRINFLAGRLPQPVERSSAGFFNLYNQPLNVGNPALLLQYRPDIRQAERELLAAGLDVKVARAHFYPRIDINGVIGTQAFNPKYLFNPESFVTNLAGELTAPLINKAAIKAEYRAANARQLEAVYNYQRVILSAYTEVVNRVAQAENYRKGIEFKQQQLTSLEAARTAAGKLFGGVRAEYLEVLLTTRELLEAQTTLIQMKRQQLSAVVNAYQALGGGNSLSIPAELPPKTHPLKGK